MVLTFGQIIETLRKHVVKLSYSSRDGGRQTVRCTLSNMHYETAADEKNTTITIISAWDVDRERWIMIDLNRITNFEPEV